MHAEMIILEARMRHADLQREAEQLRLTRQIGRQTTGAYRERRSLATTPKLSLLGAWVQARLVGNQARARKRALA